MNPGKRNSVKGNICGASFAQRCFRCRIEDKTNARDRILPRQAMREQHPLYLTVKAHLRSACSGPKLRTLVSCLPAVVSAAPESIRNAVGLQAAVPDPPMPVTHLLSRAREIPKRSSHRAVKQAAEAAQSANGATQMMNTFMQLAQGAALQMALPQASRRPQGALLHLLGQESAQRTTQLAIEDAPRGWREPAAAASEPTVALTPRVDVDSQPAGPEKEMNVRKPAAPATENEAAAGIAGGPDATEPEQPSLSLAESVRRLQEKREEEREQKRGEREPQGLQGDEQNSGPSVLKRPSAAMKRPAAAPSEMPRPVKRGKPAAKMSTYKRPAAVVRVTKPWPSKQQRLKLRPEGCSKCRQVPGCCDSCWVCRGHSRG